MVLIIDVFAGRIVHRLPLRLLPSWSGDGGGGGGEVRVLREGRYRGVRWQRHLGEERKKKQRKTKGGVGGVEGLMGMDVDVEGLLKEKGDLPRELAMLEVEGALPRLATLPPASGVGVGEDVFGSRAGVDGLFHAEGVRGGKVGTGVDVLVVDLGGGVVNVSVFDSFVVGSVDVGTVLPKGWRVRRVVGDAGGEGLARRYLVVEAVMDGVKRSDGPGEETRLHVVEMDLRFMTQTGYNLPLLATKATQLQNLLRYIAQISEQLSVEVRTAFDLPARFVANVNEALGEGGAGMDFRSQAYQLIVTGMCNDVFRDWLVDEVGERGLKRWEKAVGDCLDMIKRMTSECLLPAIERAQIVLSRLDGLARFSDTAGRLGLDEKAVRSVRDVLDVVGVLCEDMLRDVCAEVREFAAFMRWFKWELEVIGLGEDSERADELRESWNGEAEVRTVLDYVESAMKKSRVTQYVHIEKQHEPSPEKEIPDGTDLMAHYKKVRTGGKGTERPKLDDLLRLFTRRSEVVFRSIAETLRKSVLTSYVGELPEECDATMLDTRLEEDTDHQDHYSLRILSTKKAESAPAVLETVFHINAGTRSAPQRKGPRSLDLSGSADVLDVKIKDDTSYLVLCSDKTSSNRAVVQYGFAGDKRGAYTLHDGDIGNGMTAGSLAVTGRADREDVVVTDVEKMGFAVLRGHQGDEVGSVR